MAKEHIRDRFFAAQAEFKAAEKDLKAENKQLENFLEKLFAPGLQPHLSVKMKTHVTYYDKAKYYSGEICCVLEKDDNIATLYHQSSNYLSAANEPYNPKKESETSFRYRTEKQSKYQGEIAVFEDIKARLEKAGMKKCAFSISENGEIFSLTFRFDGERWKEQFKAAIKGEEFTPPKGPETLSDAAAKSQQRGVE